uniref:CSON001527 protein n=1 Tax=Culicoides sonorensis TaxID=179676 RepID=A0A336ML95_CULSO
MKFFDIWVSFIDDICLICSKPEDHQHISHSLTNSFRIHKRAALDTSSPSSTTVQPQNSFNNNNNNNLNNNSDSSSNLSNVNLQQQQKLLGVNGTGQRKDLSSFSTTPKAELAATIATPSLKQYKSDNQTYAYPDESITLDIDESDDDTQTHLKENNITKYEEDYHIYYNSTVIRGKDLAEKHRKDLGNLAISNMLSHSYRRAMTIKLSFDFPFYGHPVRNVTVATGGFLYTGEHVHSWLAATQYIAPLMANFDTSQTNDSYVKYSDNGTAFTVLWENVRLQDKDKVGTFTFSATLYNTGDIIFAYYSVPINIDSIQDDKHPVKVGLSDAYIIDKTIFCKFNIFIILLNIFLKCGIIEILIVARRKTIYEYHRVNFANGQIENNTIIQLTALPTCLSYTDCQSCVESASDLKCLWCPSINRCSTGTDRKRQEWLHKSCDASKINQAGLCPKIGEKGNDYKATTEEPDSTNKNISPSSTTESNVEKSNSVTQSSRINNRKMNLDEHGDEIPPSPEHVNAKQDESNSSSMGTALGFIIPIGLVLTAVLWVFYAYRNPHTKSGQFLIQYRPSQWGWRRGEAHYTAAVQQLYIQ